jgi:hypothetical protein
LKGLKGLKKVSDNNNKIPVYLFKGKPLQNKFNNDYNRAEKIEIILQLQNDFDNGILSPNTLLSIIYNKSKLAHLKQDSYIRNKRTKQQH